MSIKLPSSHFPPQIKSVNTGSCAFSANLVEYRPCRYLPWCCGRRVLSKPLGYGWRAPHAAVLAATLAVDARRRYQSPYRSPPTTTERVLIVNDSAMKGNRSVQHVCDLVSVARLPHLASSLLATQPRGERANKEPLDGPSPRSAIIQ